MPPNHMDTLIGTVMGILIGYVLGSRNKADNVSELREARKALKRIAKSEDFRALRSSALPIARAVYQQLRGMVRGQLRNE